MAGREENSDESSDHANKGDHDLNFYNAFMCLTLKAYPWQSCDSLHDKKQETDKRREELLDLMYDSTSNEIEGMILP